MRDKKKFSMYAEKFERFLVEITEISLKLFKHHVMPQALIPMVGRNEIVNIEELKSTEDISYQIKVEARADDIETQMGKQLTLNHLVQFAGSQLNPQDLGQIVRAMPFSNKEEMLTDLTIDYDIAKNTILALDRGEQVQAEENENHSYMVRKLMHRMKQPDFKFLDPQIQEAYFINKQQHEQIMIQQQQAIQAANADLIPTSGALVAADIYIQSDPEDPSKTKRARIPHDSLKWLLDRIEQQGTSLQSLEGLQDSAVAEIAALSQQGQPGVGQL